LAAHEAGLRVLLRAARAREKLGVHAPSASGGAREAVAR
jgi:hypothetical protein